MNSFGQGASNKGTEFWLGYGKHVSVGQMVLYITSDVNTTATVTIPGLGFTQTVTITANQVQFVDIPTSAHLNNDGRSQNAIHVTSLKPVIVYAHIYQNSVSGATLVLPVNTLGKDYYSINYKQESNSTNSVSWFFVVAVEDDTQVEITPTAATQGGWAANSQNIISLKKGEIYNVLGTFTNFGGTSSGGDLTGSRIKSISSSNGTCKKIAVFSGSSKISINCLNYNFTGANPGSADNLFQQAYPTSTWGKSFITVPHKDRNFVIYRVIKSDPTAVVTLNGSIIPNSSFVNSFYYQFASQSVDEISSDKPIQLVQYAVTQNRSITCTNNAGDVGDPEMIFLNPLEQTLTQITMYSTPRFSITKHFINVVIKSTGVASFKLDGVNVANQFLLVPNNPSYSYAQLSVTEGTHNLLSDEGFNATAYGFGNADSYGYAAGANLTAFGIDPVLKGNTSSSVQTGCVGVEYSLNLKLPYEASDIQFDNGDGSGLKYITLQPILPNEVKDGVTIYNYSLISSITFTKDYTYSYKIRTTKPTADACGTGDEFVFDFIINPLPVADFNLAAKACLNNLINFSTIDIPTQTITDYLWDFNGEGRPSTNKNAQYAFNTSGLKSIKLSVKSAEGCWSDLVVKNIEIVPLPVANFSNNAITCVNNQINFTNQSTTVDGIMKYDWDFGDPTSTDNISLLENPSHTFVAVGTYNIKLIVTTDLGCADTIIKQITINPLSIVDFETPDICLSDASALFTNKTTISDNSALTYFWNFGDPASGANNTSASPNPTHKYSVAKDYDVTLTVTSAKGCITTITKKFTVNGSTPKADFIVQNESALCSNQTVNFTDNSTVDFGEITKIEWVYDNSNPAVKEIDNNPNLRSSAAKKIYTHTYPTFYSPAQKTVNVTMTAYSGIECLNTQPKSIILKAIPKADFTLPDGCLPNGEALFTNLSTFVGAKLGLTYLWDFGEGSNQTSKIENPTHQYRAAGTYQVTLTVTAANGCSETIIKPFTVKGAIANTNFTVLNSNGLCSDTEVTFVDNTNISFGQLNKVEWFFDNDNQPNNAAYNLIDNNPPVRSEIQKTYIFKYPVFNTPLERIINVKMRTTSGDNCVSEVIKSITLKAVPNVVFNTLTNVCAEVLPYKITQASETSGMLGNGVYSGKGIAADGLFSPAMAGVGIHPITYTFTGENNCQTAKTQDIEVYETPKLDAGTDKVILLGGEILLDAIAVGKNVSYKWTPSTGLNRDDVLNPIASPVEDITYTLTLKSDEGCTIIDEVFVQVLKFPEIPNTFTPNGDGVNDTWNIKYLSSYPNASIKIFNRYGKEVFRANDYTTPWDGRLNNEFLPQGVYYYVITAKDGELKYSGSVTIVK
ncbi:PKD domain-containing protein [Pedobacter alpinus]|uniref:PKD domain-containing protein n=1 Tax=Pedobacter alpinus TaxID=1590643 RepID=A0ABW5TTQ3_9SPHI